ncbi:fasciclin domain-containing protein [Methanoculleus horonobensis]|uniref:fasciclin domain-containing protein n=1 Tax=Methanoculleus horonobensis TaxID=528314 RepID=UPI00137254A5|nr:fasciclin domain-containing protein [Methanoculleus horonobensis]
MNITPLNSTETYEVPQATVLGALDVASILGAFDYQVIEDLPPEEGNLSILSIADIENELINETPHNWTYWVNDEQGTTGAAVTNVSDGDNLTFSFGSPSHTLENATYTLTVNVTVPGAVVTPEPTVNVTPEPTVNVTPEPTVNVTPEPTVNVTPEPTVNVTPEPTVNVTPEPTVNVTPEPTVNVTPEPTVNVTPEPTVNVTPEPTVNVTPEPTVNVTPEPTPPANVTPSVNVSDQPIENDSVMVDNATINQTGWADIHADLNGTPGPIIGYTQIDEGVNENVSVEIEVENATPVLYAMLHIDAGEQGVHEFPGPDVPILVNGSPVQQAFNVTGGLPEENVTPEPTVNVTPEPTVNVTPEPTVNVTPEPTVNVTPEPTVNVTPEPTVNVTPEPTVNVTPEPTVNVTPEPTVNVTPEPTVNVTPEPTVNVTPEPTVNVTPEPTVNVTPTPAPEANITELIITELTGEENLTTFVGAVNNSTIGEELDENASYAICAPTNEAFAGLGNQTLSVIMGDEMLLNRFLGYHVIQSDYTVEELVQLCEASENGQISLPTAEGSEVNVSLAEDGRLTINNIIVITQIQITNKIVIYVIGTVLVPPDTPIPTPTPTVTPEPTVNVTPEPTVNVTPEPTVNVTPEPTVNVTPEPTVNVTPEPTVNVTPEPTVNVTPEPTVNVTPEPTVNVTPEPTVNVTPTPTPPMQGETTDLQLYEGWNFVSIPRPLSVGNDTAAAVFADVDTGGRSFYTYTPAGGFAPLGENETLRVLEGYWVYSTEETTVELMLSTDPVRAPALKTLSPGWNAIGYSDLTERSADEALTSVEDIWVYVVGYDAESQSYRPAFVNNQTDDQELFPTEGYWVFVREDGRLAAISA